MPTLSLGWTTWINPSVYIQEVSYPVFFPTSSLLWGGAYLCPFHGSLAQHMERNGRKGCLLFRHCLTSKELMSSNRETLQIRGQIVPRVSSRASSVATRSTRVSFVIAGCRKRILNQHSPFITVTEVHGKTYLCFSVHLEKKYNRLKVTFLVHLSLLHRIHTIATFKCNMKEKHFPAHKTIPPVFHRSTHSLALR